jgi:Taurine catabolism dioxygenase TauD, TfdA family
MDPAAWHAAAMRADRSWEVWLEDDDQGQLGRAVAESAKRDEPIHRIDRRTFRLSRLARKLEGVRRDVIEGRGFAMIRGLDLGRFSRDEILRAYFGIGSYLGSGRPQNAAGHWIGHVRDLGEGTTNPATRLYRTNARQRFHVDSCDVVGLLCLQKARSGGASFLCSSLAIVEEIATTRPDLLAVLERPFFYDRKDEVPEGKGPYYEIPIVHRHQGKTSVYFARDFIESAQKRFPEIPRLTPEQVEALDMVERLAESDEFRLSIAFEPGDIQFVHNHVLLHSREAYEDGPGPQDRRHLLRLWLSAHGPRPLPPVFAERYGPMVEGEPRGGIQVPGVEPRIPLEAE